MFLEDGFHLHRHIDGVTRQTEVEVVGEECLKLQTDEGTLGDDGTVLLLDGEEMLVRLTVGEHYRLATQGTDLRATNVEHITVASQIGQGDIVALCHQTIAQTGSVNVEGDVVALTDLIDVVELTGTVERA